MFEPNKESRIGKVKAVRDIFLCFFTVGSVIIPYLPTLVLYSDTDFKLIKVVKRFCPLSSHSRCHKSDYAALGRISERAARIKFRLNAP